MSNRAKPASERLGRANRPAKAAPAPKLLENFEPPEPPDTVTDLDLWADIWRYGGAVGVYHTDGDYAVIVRYVELQQRRAKLAALVESEGFTETGSTGSTVQNPTYRILQSVEADLLKLEDRLGLNPQARNTVVISHAEATGALEGWLGKTEGAAK